MDISLRKVTDVDGILIVKWRNENKQYFGAQENISLVGHLKWYRNTYLYDPTDHYFMVYADGMRAGTISYNSCSQEIGRVLLGNKSFARKGVMTEAMLEIRRAFLSRRYWLKVLTTNTGAIEFYERCGFERKGSVKDMTVMELNL